MALNKEVFGKELAGEVGIIMPNHLASKLDGSLGDRAEHLSNETGLTVIAFERPGTGSLPRVSAFTAESYLADVDERGVELQGILKELGIERAILTEISAAALDALALAASGKVAVEKVVAIDPVGMYDVPISERFKWGRKTLRSDKGLHLKEFRGLRPLRKNRQKDADGFIAQVGTAIETAPRAKDEIVAYKEIYPIDISTGLLRKLKAAGIPADVIIGERSHTAPPKVQKELIGKFKGTSVNIDIIPDAEHGFGEPSAHFVHLVTKKIQPVLDGLKEPEA